MSRGFSAVTARNRTYSILGVDKPIDKAECVIIATVMRTDDNEDKW